MKYTTPVMRMVDADHDGWGRLVIEDGIIQEVHWTEPGEDASRVLMPAFADLHVHFRDPGQTHKEDLETGMRAALAGGFTDVQLMANTVPITSTMEQARDVVRRADALEWIRVHPCLSITTDFDGASLAHLDDAAAPVTMLSDDGKGVESAAVMLEAMRKAEKLGIGFTLHEEDPSFSATDMRLAEDVMTHRDLYLATLTEAHLHFAHVSTRESIRMIREAKRTNPRITCEAAPHHLVLWDSDYRVNPPIRAKEDVMALRDALQDGTIDAIATDHAPHTAEDKAAGAPGMVGLEIAFALCYTHLIRENIINMQTLSRLMSANPARLLGRNRGRLLPGQEADLVEVDLSHTFTVDPSVFESKGKNTVFAGSALWGRIVRTIVRGEERYPFDNAQS